MNSQYAMEQLPKVMEKLLARTQEGKVSWNEGVVLPNERDQGIEEYFYTELDNSLDGGIEAGENQLSFFLSRDEPQYRRLLEISFPRARPRYGFDSEEEERVWKMLGDLHQSARRSALKLDIQIDSALGFLDRLR